MSKTDRKEKTPRKLTQKEIKRAAIIDKLSQEKEAEGYKRVDLTIGIGYANVMAFVLCAPLCLPFAVLFFVRNGQYLKDYFMNAEFYIWFIWLASFLAACVVHELIHGLVWGICAPGHFKSIDFGFIAEMVTPYCTCIEPLKKGQYIIGSFMPGLVLGILPLIIAIFTGSYLVYVLGLSMLLGAGGDFMIILKILTHKTDKTDIIYVDHPTECGLILFEK